MATIQTTGNKRYVDNINKYPIGSKQAETTPGTKMVTGSYKVVDHGVDEGGQFIIVDKKDLSKE